MSDEVWRREPIESPCTRICVIHPETRLCTGCHRSIEEIGGWMNMTDKEREAVMADLPRRTAIKPKRRGGRAARIAGHSDSR